MSRLSVIVISAAFGEFWNDLAEDLDVVIDLLDPAKAAPPQVETAAIIVAAGGAERDAIQWLASHPVPPGVPTLVVGTDPGRRTAMQVVTHGASDYFALPDDLEIFRNAVAAAVNAGRARAAAAVNCSALPEHLIESELFGHERGSFTDAHAAKPGLFEVADTGTLFLDEIGDLPIAVQAKLLRVLEDKEIRRVGGTKSRAVDVRILAAANDRLAERVREGAFRKDLFFRLSTVVLSLPPLRERGDDLMVVAQALLERLAGEHGLPVPTLTPEVVRRLRAHPWPGNIRELKNAVERALLLSPAGELSVEELLPPADPDESGDGPIPFPAPLEEITNAAAHATVKLCGGNRSESARRLGISPRRLRRLLSGAGVGSDLDAPGWLEPGGRSVTRRPGARAEQS